MVKNSERTANVMNGFGKLLNGIYRQELTIENIAEMEDEEFDLYRSLAKSYLEFSELSVSYAEQLDEQSEMLENLQRDVKKILER